MVARRTIDKYLAALPAEPEIEGVRVSIPVAVCEDGTVAWLGTNLMSERDAVFVVKAASADTVGGNSSIQWVKATLKPYAPPAEPVVEGRVVEP